MKLRTVATACLAALLFAATAQAAPNRLDVLRQAVQNRAEEGLTRPQIRALARADKLLGKTPANMMGEIATAIAVVRLLDKAFPGDAQFAFDFDNAIPLIEGDVKADHDALVTLLGELPDDRRQFKAQLALDAAEASVAAVAAAADRRTKLALLRSAVASIGRGFNAVTRRQSYAIATLDDGTGPRRVVSTKLNLLFRYDPEHNAHKIGVIAHLPRRRSFGIFVYPVTGPASFELSTAGSFIDATWGGWFDRRRDFFSAESDPGLATITAYDGPRSFDAVFSFVAYDWESGAVVARLTKGVVRVR